MAQACELSRASEYQPSAAAACTDAIVDAKSANFAQSTASSNNCAITAHGVGGNTGNPRARGNHSKSRAPTVYSHVTTPNHGALRRRANRSRKVDGLSTPATAPLLDGFLDVHIPKSLWLYDPYTGVAFAPTSQQHAPNPYLYAPLQQNNQYPAQHTSRFQSQLTTSQFRPAAPSSAPRYSYPATSSGTFVPPLPITYDPQISPQQQSNRSSSIVNAVNSAGRGAQQLFADVTLNGSVISRALIDTGATSSMIPMRTLRMLPDPPSVENFKSAPPNIVGVGGARVATRGYIDATLNLAGTIVQHPVIVVDDLAFPLLVGMDVLRSHDAQLGVGASQSFRLAVDRCSTCVEERSPPAPGRSPTVAATVAEQVTLLPHAASRVVVRLPAEVLGASFFLTEPLPFLLDKSLCAALPSVNKISGCTHSISVVNSSDAPVVFQPGASIAAVSPLEPHALDASANSAAISHLPRDEKLKKVLSDLHFDAIKLDSGVKSKLRSLIEEQLDVFAECDSDVGTTDIVFHEIDTGDSRPLRQPARRVPYGEQRAVIEKEIEKLVDADIARPSTSPWASPIVMVKKKDGSWRMCVDYRRVNKATKFDCFPLPRLDEALDAFAGCTVFSSLDLAMAYHQVPVAPADVEKTAFITHVGLFEMVKMPFGLCNAPSTYQRLMSIVLRGLISRICLAYLDDVIVFSRRLDLHLGDLRAVFTRIREAGLKLKPSKCQLFRDEVLYLGHVINSSGVSPDPAKLRVLSTWPVPEDVRGIQSFLGFVNFYGDFIHDATSLTAPLYALTAGRKGTDKVVLGVEELAAFNKLKQALIVGPQLAHPDLNKQFIVHTDASKIAIGAVLFQRSDDDVERPISFFSKKLSSPQQNYSTFERECLAVVDAVQHFRVYLLGRPFVFGQTTKRSPGCSLRSPKVARESVDGSQL